MQSAWSGEKEIERRRIKMSVADPGVVIGLQFWHNEVELSEIQCQQRKPECSLASMECSLHVFVQSTHLGPWELCQ